MNGKIEDGKNNFSTAILPHRVFLVGNYIGQVSLNMLDKNEKLKFCARKKWLVQKTRHHHQREQPVQKKKFSKYNRVLQRIFWHCEIRAIKGKHCDTLFAISLYVVFSAMPSIFDKNCDTPMLY